MREFVNSKKFALKKRDQWKLYEKVENLLDPQIKIKESATIAKDAGLPPEINKSIDKYFEELLEKESNNLQKRKNNLSESEEIGKIVLHLPDPDSKFPRLLLEGFWLQMS